MCIRDSGHAVWSVERYATLGRGAAQVLSFLGYRPHLTVGDGAAGWPEAAPYDAILVTCLLYTSPSPRDRTRSRMPSSA